MLILLFSNSCTTEDEKWHQKNKLFIAKHGEENFAEFINHSATLRSWEDRGQNACILVFNENDTGFCRSSHAVIINAASQTVKAIRREWTDSNAVCYIDTALSVNIAQKLLRDNLFSLAVDSNKNVFIKTIYSEGRSDLIKFSDPKYITEEYKKRYQKLSGSWYERIEF